MAALNSGVCVATGGLYFLGEPWQISAVNKMTPLTGANYVLLHGDTASSLFNEAHTGSSELCTWWFGGPVTDGDPAHSRCCFFFSPSSQLVKNIATKSLRPLLLFVFHAGSNRNLHNESTVLFLEFKDKTRWWIVHKMKRWRNHEIIIEATTQYILHTACSRAVCCYHKTNCKKKKKVEKKTCDISLHANIASLPSEQVRHHILYDMNWCSLNSAWMYVSWQSDPIQKIKIKILKSHPDRGKEQQPGD